MFSFTPDRAHCIFSIDAYFHHLIIIKFFKSLISVLCAVFLMIRRIFMEKLNFYECRMNNLQMKLLKFALMLVCCGRMVEKGFFINYVAQKEGFKSLLRIFSCKIDKKREFSLVKLDLNVNFSCKIQERAFKIFVT